MPKKAKAKKELTYTVAVPRQQHRTEEVPFELLKLKSYMYLDKPEYQREETWSPKGEVSFLDSVFRGDPFPPITAYLSFFQDGPHIGEPRFMLSDGQNRLKTILKFMNDGIRLMTIAQKQEWEPNSKEAPVCPGMLFSELDPATRNFWNGYKIRIDILANRDEAEMITQYIRSQYHVALSFAEKLKANNSKAKAAGLVIEEHPFWKEFYYAKMSRAGKKANRGETFQSGLNLLAMEATGAQTINLMAERFLDRFAGGQYDDLINEDLVQRVNAVLNDMSVIYRGTLFTRRIVSVAMYQSVKLLQRKGYAITQKDEGKLTAWVMGLLDEARRQSGTPAYANQMQLLSTADGQESFWRRHEEAVLRIFGLAHTIEVPAHATK